MLMTQLTFVYDTNWLSLFPNAIYGAIGSTRWLLRDTITGGSRHPKVLKIDLIFIPKYSSSRLPKSIKYFLLSGSVHRTKDVWVLPVDLQLPNTWPYNRDSNSRKLCDYSHKADDMSMSIWRLGHEFDNVHQNWIMWMCLKCVNRTKLYHNNGVWLIAPSEIWAICLSSPFII